MTTRSWSCQEEEIRRQHTQAAQDAPALCVAGNHGQVGAGGGALQVEEPDERRGGHHGFQPRQLLRLGPLVDQRQDRGLGKRKEDIVAQSWDGADQVQEDGEVAVEPIGGQDRAAGWAGDPHEALDPNLVWPAAATGEASASLAGRPDAQRASTPPAPGRPTDDLANQPAREWETRCRRAPSGSSLTRPSAFSRGPSESVRCSTRRCVRHRRRRAGASLANGRGRQTLRRPRRRCRAPTPAAAHRRPGAGFHPFPQLSVRANGVETGARSQAILKVPGNELGAQAGQVACRIEAQQLEALQHPVPGAAAGRWPQRNRHGDRLGVDAAGSTCATWAPGSRRAATGGSRPRIPARRDRRGLRRRRPPCGLPRAEWRRPRRPAGSELKTEWLLDSAIHRVG